jgi:hypothetical protein
MCRQSCATTMAAMVMETSTASGAATRTGMQNASKGTAIRASPKPNAERMSVAAKMMRMTKKLTAWMGNLPAIVFSLRRV